MEDHHHIFALPLPINSLPTVVGTSVSAHNDVVCSRKNLCPLFWMSRLWVMCNNSVHTVYEVIFVPYRALTFPPLNSTYVTPFRFAFTSKLLLAKPMLI
jgi:hypothetical protein